MSISRTIRLLVADDHRLFTEGLRMVIKEELGLELAGTAANGREAIDMCLSLKIDVIFMDLNMPVIGGLEATEEIKRLRPDVKVVIVSMNAEHATVSKAVRAGADAYILKNEASAEIVKAVKSVLKGELYLSEILSSTLTKDGEGRIVNKDEFIRFTDNLITSREQAVLKLIVEGYTNQQIAETLHISVRTVDTHRANMLTKLKLSNTAMLVKYALENKLV